MFQNVKRLHTPISTPNCRSSVSFLETGGRSTAVRGKLHPFLLPNIPPFSTSHLINPSPMGRNVVPCFLISSNQTLIIYPDCTFYCAIPIYNPVKVITDFFHNNWNESIVNEDSLARSHNISNCFVVDPNVLFVNCLHVLLVGLYSQFASSLDLYFCCYTLYNQKNTPG